MNHESHESTRRLRGFAARECLFFVGYGLLCACLVALVGCGTPRGYDDDLTPDDNGEQWIGGAALQAYSPDARAAMRAEPSHSAAPTSREMRPARVPADAPDEAGMSRDWYVGECPRTDAQARDERGRLTVDGQYVPSAFARVLERDLKEALK